MNQRRVPRSLRFLQGAGAWEREERQIPDLEPGPQPLHFLVDLASSTTII